VNSLPVLFTASLPERPARLLTLLIHASRLESSKRWERGLFKSEGLCRPGSGRRKTGRWRITYRHRPADWTGMVL